MFKAPIWLGVVRSFLKILVTIGVWCKIKKVSQQPSLIPVEKPFTTNDTESIVPECPSRITRADVARYMLDVIDDEGSYRKIRAIGVDAPQ